MHIVIPWKTQEFARIQLRSAKDELVKGLLVCMIQKDFDERKFNNILGEILIKYDLYLKENSAVHIDITPDINSIKNSVAYFTNVIKSGSFDETFTNQQIVSIIINTNNIYAKMQTHKSLLQRFRESKFLKIAAISGGLFLGSKEMNNSSATTEKARIITLPSIMIPNQGTFRVNDGQIILKDIMTNESKIYIPTIYGLMLKEDIIKKQMEYGTNNKFTPAVIHYDNVARVSDDEYIIIPEGFELLKNIPNDVIVTAYNPTGKGLRAKGYKPNGNTSTGNNATKNFDGVAVDQSIIPASSLIRMPSGEWKVADDTGHDIIESTTGWNNSVSKKTLQIDVRMKKYKDAMNFGRNNVKDIIILIPKNIPSTSTERYRAVAENRNLVSELNRRS